RGLMDHAYSPQAWTSKAPRGAGALACDRTSRADRAQPCAAVLRSHFAAALFQRSLGRIRSIMPVAPRLTASLILAAALVCGGAAGAAEPGAIATAAPAGSGAPPNAAPASSAPASSA